MSEQVDPATERGAEPEETGYEPPMLEEISGDDRATTGAWITGFEPPAK
jgi:hypothetical protein